MLGEAQNSKMSSWTTSRRRAWLFQKGDSLWRVIQRKLKMLDVAQRISDLRSPPGNRLEALRGNQRGRHSIRVNEQYRVTFRWEGNHAYEVRCEDYHS